MTSNILQSTQTEPSEPISFFEGPEKTLEVEFQGAKNHSLRSASRQSWDTVVEKAAATILHHISNDHFDSYILSESSLFVTDNKVIMKTCGTTTLLHALPEIHRVGESVGLQIGFTTFMRKDLQAPDRQEIPHRSFGEEIDFFADFFHTQGDIVGQVMGPVTSDRLHLCTSPTLPLPLCCQPAVDSSCTVNMMMYGLNAAAARKFCKSSASETGAEMTTKSGIRALLPAETEIHEWAFDPCGYSMNALTGKFYSTAHVTPESSCSYASFETTIASWNEDNICQVLDVFLPSRFTITKSYSHGFEQSSFSAVLKDSDGRVFHRIVLQQTNVSGREFVMANYRCFASVDSA